MYLHPWGNTILKRRRNTLLTLNESISKFFPLLIVEATVSGTSNSIMLTFPTNMCRIGPLLSTEWAHVLVAAIKLVELMSFSKG